MYIKLRAVLRAFGVLFHPLFEFPDAVVYAPSSYGATGVYIHPSHHCWLNCLDENVTVPTSWDICIVDGATELTVMTDASGEAYVLVDIVPDSGAVTLALK